MSIVIIILVFYLAIMLAVGYAGKKYSSNMNDFLVAGKQGTMLMLVGSCMGSHIGNGIVVGGAEYGAAYGIGGIWYGIGACFSYFLFSMILAKRVYRGGYITIPDLLKKRYGGTAISVVMAILNICATIGIISAQVMAGARLCEYIGISPVLGSVSIVAVIIIYSSISGMWGVMMTDVIQSSVIVICTIIVIITIAAKGGFTLMANMLPDESFSLIPFGAEQFIKLLVPTALFGLLSGSSFQRTASSRTEKVAVVAPVIAGIVLIPFVSLPVIIGMYGRAIFPDAKASTIIFKVLLESMSPVVSGLLVTAILVAVMSTVDSALIGVTANAVNDIYLKIIKPDANDKTLINVSRLVTIAAGSIALFVSLQFNSILSLLSSTYSFMTAGGVVMVAGGIFWSKGTSSGAIASAVFGMLFVALNKLGIVSLPYASITPIIPSFIAYVIVSLATQPKNTDTENLHRMA